MLVAEPVDTPAPLPPLTSSPPIVIPAPTIVLSSPPSSLPPIIKTIDERNDARTDTDTPTTTITIPTPPSPSSSLRIDPSAAVLPSAIDLPPPRGAGSSATTPTTEWIPEGPFEERSDEEETRVTDARRAAVREAFQHAWQGYEQYAFGHDELRPVTRYHNRLMHAYHYGMVGMVVIGIECDE